MNNMFNIGDKVVCINLDRIQKINGHYDQGIRKLKLDDAYTVKGCNSKELISIDDNTNHLYHYKRFISFNELRKLKIKKLLKNMLKYV